MTSNAVLIEDFLHIGEILISQDAETPMATFINPNVGASEALVISKNNLNQDEVFHVYREPLSDSGWNFYGLGAGVCSMAAVDKEVLWAVGSDAQVWQNKAGRWSVFPSQPVSPSNDPIWEKTQMSGVANAIAVGTDGVVRICSAGGNIYAYNTTTKKWDRLSNSNNRLLCIQAPVGSADDLWAVCLSITNATPLGRYQGGEWKEASWPGGQAYQVCAGQDNSIFATTQATPRQLYRWMNNNWTSIPVPQNLGSIAVRSATEIYATVGGATASVHRFDGNEWKVVPGSPTLPMIDDPLLSDNIQLTITGDGTFWVANQLRRTYKAANGEGPYVIQMMPTGMSALTTGATDVAVGTDSEGTECFFNFNGGLGRATLKWPTAWYTRINIGGGRIEKMGVTNQPVGNGSSLIVFGTSAGGDMLYGLRKDNFQSRTQSASGTLKGARLQLTAVSSGGWYTSAVIGGSLWVQTGTADAPFAAPGVPNTMRLVNQTQTGGPAPSNLKEVLPLPYTLEGNLFYSAVLDDGGNLLMAANLLPTTSNNLWFGSFAYLTGNNTVNMPPSPVSKVASASAVIEPGTGIPRLYATDQNGVLWVLRGRTFAPGTYPFYWHAWHPIAANCGRVTNGPGAQGTHELFAQDPVGLLKRVWQDAATANWSTSSLHRPRGTTETPYYVSQYETEITVYGGNGLPARNVPVQISTADPVEVWVDGVHHDVDHANSLTVTTDSLGKVSLNTLALGLHTAQLTFSNPNFAKPYTVYPPQDVHNRLSNVDGPTLESAQARTQSVPTAKTEALASTDLKKNSSASASVIQDTFKIKQSRNINPGLPTGFATEGTPVSREELRAQWKAKLVSSGPASAEAAAPGLGSWDSFWQDLADFPEDIWQGIREGVLALEKIATDIEKGTIKVWVAISGAAAYAFEFIIKTIDDVVHAVVAAFKWIGAEVLKAIDWLKEFFSWTDILNTTNIIAHYLAGVLQSGIDSVAPNSPIPNLQTVVKSEAAGIIAKIMGNPNQPGTDVFSRARTTLGKQTFNQSMPPQNNPPTGTPLLNATNARKAHQDNQVHCNYANRKTRTWQKQGGNIVPAKSGQSPASFQSLLGYTRGKLNYDVPTSRYRLAQAKVQAKLSAAPVHSFFDSAVTDFTDIVEDIAVVLIDLLEDLTVIVLDQASVAITWLQDILEYQIDIPVLSWIWKELTGVPLSLLNLFSLMWGIPSTLISKIIWGGGTKPLFPDAEAKLILSQPIAWPAVGNAKAIKPPQLLTPGSPEISENLAFWLAELALMLGVGYATFDVVSDLSTETDNPTAFESISTLVLSAAIFGLTSPLHALARPRSEWTTGDILAVIVWTCAGIGVGLNIISVVASECEKLARHWAPAGPIVVGSMGVLGMLVGIFAMLAYLLDKDSGYNAADGTGAIISPASSFAKFLVIDKDPLEIATACVFDAICDVGSGICSVVSAVI